MHYLLQIDLATLEAATLDSFDGVSWTKQWQHKGGNRYVGQYTSGQANISGPIIVGNPNTPWFEIIGAYPETSAQLEALANESMPMHEALTSRGPMRAAYKLLAAPGNPSARKVLRNEAGHPVGMMCDFTIGGRSPLSSSLGGRDPEEMPELLDMEP